MDNDRSKKPLESIEARELQKFFYKALSVLLIPKGDDGKLTASSLALLFDKETYEDFERYNLKKNLLQLFKEKYPILIITIHDGTPKIGLALKDMSSPLRLTFPDQPVGITLSQFMECTPEGAEIEMTIGFIDNDKIIIEPEKDIYHLLMLKGYYFDHVG